MENNLQVTAESGEQRATTTLQVKILDVNEFVPKFEKDEYSVRVREDLHPGDVLVQVKAHDKDFSEGDKLLYKVDKGLHRSSTSGRI